MRNVRVASLALLTITMVAVSATSVVAAETPPPLSVGGSPVAPGGDITVAGSACPGAGVVLIGLLDADEESELAATSVAGTNGAWNTVLPIPSGVRPGSYTLRARCASYIGGYDGYDGYDGGGFDYPPATVTVLPPPTVPDGQSGLDVTPDVLKVGDTALVTGAGWRSGEEITVVLYSTPVVLTSTKSDDQGAISVEITIPPGTTLGAHDVVALNASSALNPPLTLIAPITVISDDDPAPPAPTVPGSDDVTSAPTTASPGSPPGDDSVMGAVRTAAPGGSGGTLPLTGSNPWTWIIGGIALLAGGAAALWFARRPLES